jgi:hypothetical protein
MHLTKRAQSEDDHNGENRVREEPEATQPGRPRPADLPYLSTPGALLWQRGECCNHVEENHASLHQEEGVVVVQAIFDDIFEKALGF